MPLEAAYSSQPRGFKERYPKLGTCSFRQLEYGQSGEHIQYFSPHNLPYFRLVWYSVLDQELPRVDVNASFSISVNPRNERSELRHRSAYFCVPPVAW